MTGNRVRDIPSVPIQTSDIQPQFTPLIWQPRQTLPRASQQKQLDRCEQFPKCIAKPPFQANTQKCRSTRLQPRWPSRRISGRRTRNTIGLVKASGPAFRVASIWGSHTLPFTVARTGDLARAPERGSERSHNPAGGISNPPLRRESYLRGSRSPASMDTGRMFPTGGVGQVPKSLNALG